MSKRAYDIPLGSHIPCAYFDTFSGPEESACSVDARVVVDDVPFCDEHAGKVALEVLKEEEGG